MKMIEPSIEISKDSIISSMEILEKIEYAGRISYKSEAKITKDSCKIFVKNIIKRGHESVLEHQSLSVKVICDRGVSHEIVRHRIASYTQESTRYCNYSKNKFGNEITVIKPSFWNEKSIQYKLWKMTMLQIESNYMELLENGATPQEARSILPNSLKTEIYMTMNLREWRHFFRLRTSKSAHPQMQEVANMILKEFRSHIPIIFDDI